MNNHSKLKIVFFASYSTTVLKHYWDHLDEGHDCWWATFSPHIYAEMKKMGYRKVFFKNTSWFRKEFKPRILYRVLKKINSIYVGRIMQRLLIKMIGQLNPDILISDTITLLTKYCPNIPETIMKVQVFHSIPYKKHCFIPETLKYDLILLPGEFHKRGLSERLNIDDTNKLKVVGWPRVDNFIKNKFSEKDRDIFMKELGLNPEFKNVLYAPSWNGFYRNRLFPKSFGFTTDAFEEFCKKLKEMNINLIIKLHPIANKLISNVRLHRIAKKYKVHLACKSFTGHIESSVPHFVWLTDVLISDVSGIIIDFMVLNRPIVYIEPDAKGFKWQEADLPEGFRAGVVAKSMEELIGGVERSLKNPDEYKFNREEILQKLFYKLDGQSSKRASNVILDYYKEFSK